MFYYLYEIKNLINGKIYVGVHKTRDMNDGYMGSGKVILAAIKKHGIENFKKVIHETFTDAKSMYAREKEVVNETFLARKDVYNIRRGGFGGFDYINKTGKNMYGENTKNILAVTHKGTKRRIELLNTNPEFKKQVYSRVSNSIKNKFANGYKNPFSGSRHSRKSKEQIGLRNSIKQQGTKNSQFGTMWITNGSKNKKIKKIEVIPQGWNKGRSMV